MEGWGQGGAVILSWLMSPLSGSLHHQIDPSTAWHGRLMLFSWGMLTPLGIGVARYYKVTHRQLWPESLDNKFWWHAHRLIQYAATLIMTVGVLLIVSTAQLTASTSKLHAIMGWVVVALGWIQVMSALARGSKGGPVPLGRAAGATDSSGDHYNMTRRRRAFEYFHKSSGYLATLLAVGSIFLGLKIADAPRWMVAIIVCWWALLSVAAVQLQRQGRCVDTYQAIWGPSDIHPGNNMKPIGWGIRRRS